MIKILLIYFLNSKSYYLEIFVFVVLKCYDNDKIEYY